jgi:hypothetical protein
MNIPDQTTHFYYFYGTVIFLRLMKSGKFSSIEEDPNTRGPKWLEETVWFYFENNHWKPVGAGFSSRRVIPIDKIMEFDVNVETVH